MCRGGRSRQKPVAQNGLKIRLFSRPFYPHDFGDLFVDVFYTSVWTGLNTSGFTGLSPKSDVD
jgi:hypothetical protein